MDPFLIVKEALGVVSLVGGVLQSLFPSVSRITSLGYTVEIINGQYTKGSLEGLAQYYMDQPLIVLEEELERRKSSPGYAILMKISKLKRTVISILEQVIQGKKESQVQAIVEAEGKKYKALWLIGIGAAIVVPLIIFLVKKR